MQLLDSRKTPCQSCDIATHGAFVAKFLESLKSSILVLPDYSPRFLSLCQISFVQQISRADCLLDFSVLSEPSMILGAATNYAPYANYINRGTEHEFFSKAFVNWKSKPLYIS